MLKRILVTGISSLLFMAHAYAAPDCRLELIVENTSGPAPIELAVFATADTFASYQNPVATQTLQPDNGMAQVTLDLPAGRYAIAVFQDQNGNRQLNSNFLGLPTEPYGFSGVDSPFGPPDFAQAAVFCAGGVTVRIGL